MRTVNRVRELDFPVYNTEMLLVLSNEPLSQRQILSLLRFKGIGLKNEIGGGNEFAKYCGSTK